MNFLLTLLVGVIAAVGGFFAPHQTAPQAFGTFSPSGGSTYRLGQSIGTSNTTVKLSSFKEPVSNIPYTMTYLGSGIEYGTLSPQSSISEFVSFTGITQNSDGSAVLTGVLRGLSRTPAGSGCTASTTLSQSHAGQSIFILSDSPCLFSEYATKQNAQTIAGVFTYSSSSPPHYDMNPNFVTAASTTFASKGYADGLALAGCANASFLLQGCLQMATGLNAASSTATGSTGAYLALPALLATSTPYTGSTTTIPVTQTNGKLNQGFFDFTLPWTFAGGLLSTASTTVSATTTIVASSVTNKALVLNTLPYAFPSTRAASGTSLTENGSGSLSWIAPQATTLSVNSNVNQSSSAAATTTLYGITIPANTFTAATNKAMRINATYFGSGNGTCNAETDFGNGSSTTTIGFILHGAGGNLMRLETLMFATSTASQSFVSTGQATRAGSVGVIPNIASSDGANVLTSWYTSALTGYDLTNKTFVQFAVRSSGTPSCQLVGESVEVLSN